MPVDLQNEDSSQKEITDLLKKNIALTEEILRLTKDNHKVLWWQSLFGYIKIFMIVIPLILGFIYLPPLYEKMIKFYEQIINLNNSASSFNPATINFDSLTPEFIKNMRK